MFKMISTFCYFSVLREPEKSLIWFQQRKGCFEVPTLGMEPKVTIVLELEVSVNTEFLDIS